MGVHYSVWLTVHHLNYPEMLSFLDTVAGLAYSSLHARNAVVLHICDVADFFCCLLCGAKICCVIDVAPPSDKCFERPSRLTG